MHRQVRSQAVSFHHIFMKLTSETTTKQLNAMYGMLNLASTCTRDLEPRGALRRG
jgi:hypothetical protein